MSDVFVGRSKLLDLADELIQVTDDKQVPSGDPKPVLVVEGIAGSGRSALLRRIRARWAGRTPLVLISPLDLPGNDDTVRPVLDEAMLWLSVTVRGYKVAFPRVLLADIAMAAPAVNQNANLAVAEMYKRLEPRELMKFIEDLLRTAGTLGGVPGAGGIAEATIPWLRRLRWLTNLIWRDALRWYAGNDDAGNDDGIRALVRLNWQAMSPRPAVRNQINDQLVGALLADLRHSLAKTRNRPTNAVVLLDDGDAPSASAFVSTLLHVRQTDQTPDPLTLITVSGGMMGQDLAARLPNTVRMDESDLASEQVRRSEPLLRVCSTGLPPPDVLWLTRDSGQFDWPLEPGAQLISEAAHRLTDGHPEATMLLLRTLAGEAALINDFDAALCAPSKDGQPLEEYLLQRVTTALSPHRHPSTTLLGLLVTVSAGRDRLEAQSLASLSNATRGDRRRLFDSPTLWCGSEPSLHPFVRYLCLRTLAGRGKTHQASWHKVFTKLRAAVPPDDVAGRLHHDLALAQTPEQHAAVAGELAELLPRLPAEDWVALLDSVVATPDPRRAGRATHLIGEDGPRPGSVARLLEVLHALSDRCLSDQNTLCRLYQLAEHDFDQLADLSRNAVVLIQRAADYRRLAAPLL
jgi:hypothetical protein